MVSYYAYKVFPSKIDKYELIITHTLTIVAGFLFPDNLLLSNDLELKFNKDNYTFASDFDMVFFIVKNTHKIKEAECDYMLTRQI